MLCINVVPKRVLSLLLFAVTAGSVHAELSVLTYNLKGNGALDWSTNSSQVQAIARIINYLHPDILCLNEIPDPYVWQMTNWHNTLLPDYNFVVSPNGDTFIRNAVGSRLPILSTKSWYANAPLNTWGFNGTFTRDLWEAVIDVPDFPQPLHVLVAHLKSGTTSTDNARRAAEASAVSNFCVVKFVNTASVEPYLLAGDMNEDIEYPVSGSGHPIERLTAASTGLRLTRPINPYSLSDFTISIQTSLTRRFDYIFPCTLLYSNIQSSQVFRTGLLSPLPPGLFSNDDRTASDHLPVLMTFNNPYDKPFGFTSITQTPASLSLTLDAVPGQSYGIEVSSNSVDWVSYADNLLATNYSLTFTTNAVTDMEVFRAVRQP